MTTPNFNAASSMFRNFNVLQLRDPGFATLLEAINSSEDMRQRFAGFESRGGVFENNSAGLEDFGSKNESMFFRLGTDGAPDTIGFPDSYFAVLARKEVAFTEVVRVVGHEVSHSERGAANLVQQRAQEASIENQSKTSANLSAYVGDRVTLSLREEAAAYIDDWNLRVKAQIDSGKTAGEALDIIKTTSPRGQWEALRGYASTATGLIDPLGIQLDGRTATAAAIAWISGTIPSGVSGNYVAYYAKNSIEWFGRNGWLAADTALTIAGVTPTDLVKVGFVGEVRLSDNNTPGASTSIKVGRNTGSMTGPLDVELAYIKGTTQVQTFGQFSDSTGYSEKSFLITSGFDKYYIPDSAALKLGGVQLTAAEIASLREGNPTLVAAVIGAAQQNSTGIYDAQVNTEGVLIYINPLGDDVPVPNVKINVLKSRTSQIDGDGNTIETAIYQDGTETVFATNSNHLVLGSSIGASDGAGGFDRTIQTNLGGATVTLIQHADASTADANGEFSESDFRLVTIGGQPITVTLSPQDLAALGFTFDSLLTGTVSPAGISLIEGLNPSTQVATGAPTPVIYESNALTDTGAQQHFRTLELANGASFNIVRDDAGNVLSATYSQALGGGVKLNETYDASNTLLYTERIEPILSGVNAGQIKETLIRPDGSALITQRDADGLVIGSPAVVAPYNDRLINILAEVPGFIGAIRSGQPLPIVTGGLKLLNELDKLSTARGSVNERITTATAANAEAWKVAA